MRYEALKKRVSKTGGVCGAIVAGCMAVCFAAYSFYDSQSEQLRKLESSIRTTNNNIQTMDTDLAKSRSLLPIYQTIMAKSASGGSETLNRKKLAEIVTSLKERYELVEVQLSTSPINKLDKDPFIFREIRAEHTMVTVAAGALSDELFFSFIDHLMRVTPGIVRADSLNVERIGDMDEGFFQSLTTDKPEQTVKGTLTFHWIGIAKNEADAPATAGATP
jgi:hypothetical protein